MLLNLAECLCLKLRIKFKSAFNVEAFLQYIFKLLMSDFQKLKFIEIWVQCISTQPNIFWLLSSYHNTFTPMLNSGHFNVQSYLQLAVMNRQSEFEWIANRHHWKFTIHRKIFHCYDLLKSDQMSCMLSVWKDGIGLSCRVLVLHLERRKVVQEKGGGKAITELVSQNICTELWNV